VGPAACIGVHRAVVGDDEDAVTLDLSVRRDARPTEERRLSGPSCVYRCAQGGGRRRRRRGDAGSERTS